MTFHLHAPDSEAEKPDRGIFDLRDYQQEDCDAIEAHWDAGHRAVLARESTGLGKSVIAAEIARRRCRNSRVLILVDVGSLAKDLHLTTQEHTGQPQGIYTGPEKRGWAQDGRCEIVSATIQTLYAGADGEENYLKFDPLEWDCVIADESESALAERFLAVLNHFLDGNPNCKLLGLTATPYRGDGQSMGKLFDVYPTATTPNGILNRDIFWGFDNGWLVKPKQQFVRANIDLSSLKVRKRKGADPDYSNDDLAELMLADDEAQCREFAAACYGMAKGEASIVICPTIKVCEKVAGYLDGAAGYDGYAHAVHGQMGGQHTDIISDYKGGGFPCIVSVSLLFKGFDADRVKWVFMLRPTKSRRMVEQAAGRGTRPLKGIRAALGRAADATERKKIIADSEKPIMTFVDVVGLDPGATDIGSIPNVTLTDVMMSAAKKAIDPKVIDRAKRNLATAGGEEGLDVGDAVRGALGEIKAEAEAERIRKEEEADKRRAAAQARSLSQKGARASIHVDATLDVEDVGFGGGGGSKGAVASRPRGGASDKQVGALAAMGVARETAMGYSPGQAGRVMTSMIKRSGEATLSDAIRFYKAQKFMQGRLQ